MSDKPYEKLFYEVNKISSEQQKTIIKATMKTSSSITLGDIPLDTDDLVISEHLKTGYYISPEQFIEPLKAGDTVLLLKLSDEQYAIIERLVSL